MPCDVPLPIRNKDAEAAEASASGRSPQPTFRRTHFLNLSNQHESTDYYWARMALPPIRMYLLIAPVAPDPSFTSAARDTHYCLAAIPSRFLSPNRRKSIQPSDHRPSVPRPKRGPAPLRRPMQREDAVLRASKDLPLPGLCDQMASYASIDCHNGKPRWYSCAGTALTSRRRPSARFYSSRVRARSSGKAILFSLVQEKVFSSQLPPPKPTHSGSRKKSELWTGKM